MLRARTGPGTEIDGKPFQLANLAPANPERKAAPKAQVSVEPINKASGSENRRGLAEWDFWEYLLEKYPADPHDRNVLPLYGDSDTEDGIEGEVDSQIDDDISSDDENDNPNERDEHFMGTVRAESPRGDLTSRTVDCSEVEFIIHMALRSYKTKWHKYKLPKAQMETAHLRKVQRLEKDRIRRSLHRYTTRLENLKNEIKMGPWPAAKDVEAQCESLEETAYTIFEHVHLLKVLEDTTSPSKPDKEYADRRSMVCHVEEILDSDDVTLDPAATNSSSARRGTGRHQVTPLKRGSVEVLEDNQDDESNVEGDHGDQVVRPPAMKRRPVVSMVPRTLKRSRLAYARKLPMPSESRRMPVSILRGKSVLSCSRYGTLGRCHTQPIDLTCSDSSDQESEEGHRATPNFSSQPIWSNPIAFHKRSILTRKPDIGEICGGRGTIAPKSTAMWRDGT